MSEYQYYEVSALDRPLGEEEVATLRQISTRADVSPTGFRNAYQWGSLKADPAKVLDAFFDVFLYFASWGTRRMMLRVPRARADADLLQAYFVGDRSARMVASANHLALDLASDPEEGAYEEGAQGSLAALAPVRGELLQGDLRPAYLGWLLAVQAEIPDDTVEPPVPAALGSLSTAQQAMVTFLCIDVDLVTVAAMASVAPVASTPDFHQWVSGLPAGEKEGWLLRAAREPHLPLGSELLRTFRAGIERAAHSRPPQRTVGELRALAGTARVDRERAESARRRDADEAAQRERERHLDELSLNLEATWSRVDTLIEAKAYDEALALLAGLRDLGLRGEEHSTFGPRFEALSKRWRGRRAFFDRWKRANERPRG